MPITVIVRSAGAAGTSLTFDGTQRVVIGRGAGSDIRLPDRSVSHRHASLRSQGADFVVVDEGSTNGTYVGDVRVAPQTSRIVRPGDAIRVGRVWIDVRTEPYPVTRDVALATRDLALALVSAALAAAGDDPTPRIRVVEGPDQGTIFVFREEGRPYTLGRGPQCDWPVADTDASREHARIVRREGVVLVEDLGAKNGTFTGSERIARGRATVWRPPQMLKVGRTVLALEEPLNDALARIEGAPDEAMAPGERPPSSAGAHDAGESAGAHAKEAGDPPSAGIVVGDQKNESRRERAPWSRMDIVVMAAALSVLLLSMIGLVWLLHG